MQHKIRIILKDKKNQGCGSAFFFSDPAPAGFFFNADSDPDAFSMRILTQLIKPY